MVRDAFSTFETWLSGRCGKKSSNRTCISQTNDFPFRVTGNALYIFGKNEKGEKVRSNRLDVKFRLLRPRATPPRSRSQRLPSPVDARCRTWARRARRPRSTRRRPAAGDVRGTAARRFRGEEGARVEFAAYDQATLERSRRMQEREGGRHAQGPARERGGGVARAAGTRRRGGGAEHVPHAQGEAGRGEEATRVGVEPRVLAADPDAADVLAASYEPELDDGAFQERTITARPYRQPPVAQVVAELNEHGQNELGQARWRWMSTSSGRG